MTDPAVAALRREREHYVRRGRADRVAAVDAELSRLGVESGALAPPEQAATKTAPPETASIEATETATRPAPRPRRREPDVE